MRARPAEDPAAVAALTLRAQQLTEQAAAILQQLAGSAPEVAAELAEGLFCKVTGRSKGFINVTPIAGPPSEEDPSGEVVAMSAAGHGHAGIAAKGAIRSFFQPKDIDPRSLGNRKLRGLLFDDAILLLLLANPERDLIAADFKNEFARLGIKIEDTTLLSRIARLRGAEALQPVNVTGAGFYRLAPGGTKAAQTAKEKRAAK